MIFDGIGWVVSGLPVLSLLCKYLVLARTGAFLPMGKFLCPYLYNLQAWRLTPVKILVHPLVLKQLHLHNLLSAKALQSLIGIVLNWVCSSFSCIWASFVDACQLPCNQLHLCFMNTYLLFMITLAGMFLVTLQPANTWLSLPDSYLEQGVSIMASH